MNVANVQVLPVSISNFQLGEGDGMCELVSDGVKSEARLTIGNIGIGNINRITRRRSEAIRSYAERCVSEEVMLRTFSLFSTLRMRRVRFLRCRISLALVA